MRIGRDKMKEIDCPVCLEIIEFKELKDRFKYRVSIL